MNTGRPLRINELIEEQKDNVNAALMTAIEAMSQEDKEKVPIQLAQSGDIVNQACKAAFGDEVRWFEVEIFREDTDNNEDDGEISDCSERTTSKIQKLSQVRIASKITNINRTIQELATWLAPATTKKQKRNKVPSYYRAWCC